MGRHLANRDRLFLAVVPDAAAAARIHRLAGVLKRAHGFDGQPIGPDRLHISLFFLGGLSDPGVRMACEAAADVRMQPFAVWFDRTASFQGKPGNIPLVLVGEDGLVGLRSFRKALGAAMAMRGLRRPANREFTPHVTLLYSERRVEEYPIAPIAWTVSEFVLIRSRHGHAHLDRWRLDRSGEAKMDTRRP